MFDLDKKFDKERKQAIEFVRQLSKTRHDAQDIPILLVRGLVAVADNTDDPFRQNCVEILRDLSM